MCSRYLALQLAEVVLQGFAAISKRFSNGGGGGADWEGMYDHLICPLKMSNILGSHGNRQRQIVCRLSTWH